MSKVNDAMSSSVHGLFRGPAHVEDNKENRPAPGKEGAGNGEQERRAYARKTPLGAASLGGRPVVKDGKPRERRKTIYTSSTYDSDQYYELRRIALEENVPLKEVLYQFIKVGLEAFKNGDVSFEEYKQSLM